MMQDKAAAKALEQSIHEQLAENSRSDVENSRRDSVISHSTVLHLDAGVSLAVRAIGHSFDSAKEDRSLDNCSECVELPAATALAREVSPWSILACSLASKHFRIFRLTTRVTTL